ncbi:MAG TPA: hypothetical protein VGE66_12860 [Chitinophagaceae bacterium]
MKRIILLIVLTLVIVLGFYGYREYTRKNKDLKDVAPEATLSAAELIKAFETDSAGANKSYLGKIIAVKGTVKSVEKEDRSATIVLGEPGTMSSVRCSMDTAKLATAAGVQEGQQVTVKGACTGFNQDELLGSDVVLNRCVLATTEQ